MYIMNQVLQPSGGTSNLLIRAAWARSRQTAASLHVRASPLFLSLSVAQWRRQHHRLPGVARGGQAMRHDPAATCYIIIIIIPPPSKRISIRRPTNTGAGATGGAADGFATVQSKQIWPVFSASTSQFYWSPLLVHITQKLGVNLGF